MSINNSGENYNNSEQNHPFIDFAKNTLAGGAGLVAQQVIDPASSTEAPKLRGVVGCVANAVTSSAVNALQSGKSIPKDKLSEVVKERVKAKLPSVNEHIEKLDQRTKEKIEESRLKVYSAVDKKIAQIKDKGYSPDVEKGLILQVNTILEKSNEVFNYMGSISDKVTDARKQVTGTLAKRVTDLSAKSNDIEISSASEFFRNLAIKGLEFVLPSIFGRLPCLASSRTKRLGATILGTAGLVGALHTYTSPHGTIYDLDREIRATAGLSFHAPKVAVRETVHRATTDTISTLSGLSIESLALAIAKKNIREAALAGAVVAVVSNVVLDQFAGVTATKNSITESADKLVSKLMVNFEEENDLELREKDTATNDMLKAIDDVSNEEDLENKMKEDEKKLNSVLSSSASVYGSVNSMIKGMNTKINKNRVYVYNDSESKLRENERSNDPYRHRDHVWNMPPSTDNPFSEKEDAYGDKNNYMRTQSLYKRPSKPSSNQGLKPPKPPKPVFHAGKSIKDALRIMK